MDNKENLTVNLTNEAATEIIPEATECVTEVVAEAAESVADNATEVIPEASVESIPVPDTADIPEVSADEITMPQMPVVQEFPDGNGTPEYTSYVPNGTSQPAQASEVYAAAPQNTQPQMPVYSVPVYGNTQNNGQPVQQAQQPVYYVQSSTANEPPAKGLATASLVLGIISLLGLSCCGGGTLFGIVGFILGLVSKGQGNKTGTSTAGIVTSILGVVLGIVLCFVLFILASVGVLSEM